MQYAIAAELYNSGVGNTDKLDRYVNPGAAGLQQYSDIVNTDAARNLENDVQAYLDSADFGDLDPLWTKYNEGYNNAK
jgi:hypothetical protein